MAEERNQRTREDCKKHNIEKINIEKLQGKR